MGFKVGDRVRGNDRVGAHWLRYFADEHGQRSDFLITKVWPNYQHSQEGYQLEGLVWWPRDQLAPSPSPSPVRTETRREIVPGVYGRLRTLGVGSLGANALRVPVSLEQRFYTAADLREAARIFNEIADVLEEAQ